MGIKRQPTESAEQIAFLKWWYLQHPDVRIFHIPNGGKRHIKTAVQMKREGVVPGVPDLYAPAWRLWVEMKRQRGATVSAAQKDWHKYLRGLGDTVLVCKGAEDAIAQVTAWRAQASS